ncbi:protein of unknown function [Methylorubrum extorquens]|uniref:Uncharacterized protein n=1 Tax=Methylorubrum extorquens TaxID=408 RepID=A0A2N9APE3_METEX|nr:protein of unknown function [Methylorubrum extorquens]
MAENLRRPAAPRRPARPDPPGRCPARLPRRPTRAFRRLRRPPGSRAGRSTGDPRAGRGGEGQPRAVSPAAAAGASGRGRALHPGSRGAASGRALAGAVKPDPGRSGRPLQWIGWRRPVNGERTCLVEPYPTPLHPVGVSRPIIRRAVFRRIGDRFVGMRSRKPRTRAF